MERTKMSSFGHFADLKSDEDPSHQARTRVCVLVLHYTFEGKEDERHGNEADLQNLTRAFEKERGCTFRTIQSPSRTQVLSLLSTEQELDSTFGFKTAHKYMSPFSKEKPNVMLLFILSHGKNDGVICTDSGEQFTTHEVICALRQLTNYQECLKLLFFGPCRGNYEESACVPMRSISSNIEWKEKSCKIDAHSNENNLIIFYSTVESTISKRHEYKGTWMVQAIVNTLAHLEKDVALEVFLTRVQFDIHKKSQGQSGQTPQVVYTPHAKFMVQSNTKICDDACGKGAVNKIANDRFFHYQWAVSDEGNFDFSRGLALIFHWGHNTTQIANLEEVLGKLCYDISKCDMDSTTDVLTFIKTAAENHSKSFRSIVVVLLTTVSCDTENEVCVDIGMQDATPVRKIISYFVASNRAMWVGKPKLFYFLDDRIQSDNISSRKINQSELIENATCSSGVVALVATHEEATKRVISTLRLLNTSGSFSLQEAFSQLNRDLASTSDENSILQITSTLQYLVDFQGPGDMFVSPSFTFPKERRTITFKELEKSFFTEEFQENDDEPLENVSSDAGMFHRQKVNHRSTGAMNGTIGRAKFPGIKKGIWICSAIAGMGKSTVTKRLQRFFQIKFRDYLVFRISAQDINHFCYKDIELELEEILPQIDATHLQNLSDKILNKKVMVLLDGFDEIESEFRPKAAALIKDIANRELPLWITTRPHLLNDIAVNTLGQFEERTFVLEINLFDSQKQLQLVKIIMKKPKAECIDKLDKLENRATADMLGNPLHLRLLIRTEVENTKINLFELYESFVNSKIKRGYKGDDQGLEAFLYKRKKLLTRALFIREVKKLSSEEKDILTKTGILDFNEDGSLGRVYHTSIIEFLLSCKFIQQCKNVNGEDDKIDLISANIRRFIDSFFAEEANRNRFSKVEALNENILTRIFTKSEDTLTLLCEEGLLNTYSWLDGLVSSSEQLSSDNIWTHSDNFMEHSPKLFFLASCSNLAFLQELIKKGVSVQKILPELVQKNKLFAVFVIENCCKLGAVDILRQILTTDYQETNFNLKRDVFQNKSATDTHLHWNLYRNCVTGMKLYDTLMSPPLPEIAPKLEKGVHLFQGLHFAASHEQVTKLLLESGANVNGKRINGATPLHAAAELGSDAVMSELLHCKDIRVDERFKEGTTALHLAAMKSLEACQMLLAKGADIQSVDNKRQSVMHKAAHAGKIDCVIFFGLKSPDLVDQVDYYLRTPLGTACREGHLDVVKLLMAATNDVNTLERAIFDAAHEGHCDIVYYMTSKCAELLNFAPAMHKAIYSRQYEIVRRFLENGFDVNLRGERGNTALLAAASTDMDMLNLILEHKPDLRAEDDFKRNALMLASDVGDLEMVSYFLNLNIFDVNSRNNFNDCTALHFAAISGNSSILRTLLKAGCNILAQTNDGSTALHLAACFKQCASVETLLVESEGALLNVKANNGFTALESATNIVNYIQITPVYKDKKQETEVPSPQMPSDPNALFTVGKFNFDITVPSDENEFTAEEKTEQCKIFKILAKFGANLKEVMYEGKTILHLTARNELVTKFLLENGLDPHILNSKGESALLAAAYYGDVSTVGLYLDKCPELFLESRPKYKGDTLFHLAAARSNIAVLESIVEHAKKTWCKPSDETKLKSALNQQNSQGLTPLQVATFMKNWKAMGILLRAGSDPNLPPDHTPLHLAASLGETTEVELLLNSGANPKLLANEESDLYDLAVHNANLNVIEFLFANKIQRASRGNIPILHIAVLKGNLEVVKLLLKYKCDPYELSRFHENILHSAIRGKQSNYNTDAVLQYLAPLYKPLLDQENQHSQTPYQMAKYQFNFESIAMFLKQCQKE